MEPSTYEFPRTKALSYLGQNTILENEYGIEAIGLCFLGMRKGLISVLPPASY
jgi:hypothetical protein